MIEKLKTTSLWTDSKYMPLGYIILSLALHAILLFSLSRLTAEQKPLTEDKPLMARILTKEILPPREKETPALPPKSKPQKSTAQPLEGKQKESQKQAASRQLESGPLRPNSTDGQPSPATSARDEFPLEENPPAKENKRPPTAADRLFSQDVISGEARSYVRSHPSKTAARAKTGAHNDTEISFDVDDMKYHNYLLRLRETIESVWVYPPQAGRKGIFGDLFIKFTIDKNGALARVDVERTSGHRMLDEAATQALRTAFPFWPLPSEWDMDTFTITGHFVYTLQTFGPR